MLLEIAGISCGYGAAHALREASVTLAEGEIVALIGANGAGKSTLLRTVSGIMRPAAGEITFRGKRIDGLAPYAIIGMGLAHIPEGRLVFAPLTVLDNLKMGAYLRKDRKGVQADLERMFDRFPVLGQRREQLAATLSGGEQQMLAVARALMAKPVAVLMDEPSMGLSPLLVEAIGGMIREMREGGVSILLVEQNAAMALALADRAYVLELGRIVLEGAASAVSADERVRKAYLGG